MTDSEIADVEVLLSTDSDDAFHRVARMLLAEVRRLKAELADAADNSHQMLMPRGMAQLTTDVAVNQEREMCARTCDRIATAVRTSGESVITGRRHRAPHYVAHECAAAIRARKT